MGRLKSRAAFLAALAFLLWRGTAPAAGIYALAYFGMSYLSSWLISGGRYLFGCVGLFLALGSVRRPALRAVLLAGEGALFLLYAVYYMQGQAIMYYPVRRRTAARPGV